MTTPGGVPNLPVGALTIDTLAAKLQDLSPAAMLERASERMPAIFDASTGGSILSDLSPFGIITRIWAEVNSAIANADPADINGPEDLPQLLLDFIEDLPVVGELVGLLEAIAGTYTGDDAVLLAIQEIFAPIRKLLLLVAGQDVGVPTVEEITAGWVDLGSAITDAAADFAAFVASTGQATAAALGAALQILIGWQSGIPLSQVTGLTSALAAALTSASPLNAANLFNTVPLLSIPTGIALGNIAGLTGYLANLNPTGILALSGLGTGSLPVGISAGISQITGLSSQLAAALTSASPLNAANLFGFAPTASIPPITPAMAPALAPLDALVNAFGVAGTGFVAGDLVAAAQSAQYGPQQIAASLAATVQQFGAAVGAGASAAAGDVANRLAVLFGTAQAAKTLGQSATDTLAAQSAINPAYFALEPGANPSFPLPIQTGEYSTIPVTRSSPAMVLIDTPKGGIQKALKWIGKTTTNLTGFYVAIHKMAATGELSRVYQSGNVLVNVSHAYAWNIHNFPTAADWLDAQPGDRWVAEFSVTGTGTYNLVGYANTGIPIDTTLAAGKHMGLTRAPSNQPEFSSMAQSSSATGSFSYSHNFASDVTGTLVEVWSAQTGAPTYAVTIGGKAATPLGGPQYYNSGGTAYQKFLFVCQDHPTGLQTIAVTRGGSGAVTCMGTSYAYRKLTGFGALQSVTGVSNAPSQTVSTGAANNGIFQSFSSSAGAFSAGNKTVRNSNVNNVYVQDSLTGAAPQTFTASLPASASWGGVAVPLIGELNPAPTTIANPTYSTNVGYAALTGTPGRPQHAPEFWTKDTAGTVTYTVPSWMEYGDWFDVAELSGGAGGYPGSTYGIYGSGGNPGTWQVRSLQYGVDIPLGTTSFTVTVGGAGLGGIFGDPSRPTAGGDSSVAITGYGTITAPGGTPNLTYNVNNPGYGPSPKTQTLHDITYTAGGDQGTSGGNGWAPGGPGAGGTGYGVGAPGGYGAPGRVWITALRI